MSEDPNRIFTLTAISGYAKRAFSNAHNKEFYVPPNFPLDAAAASRETTPATNTGSQLEKFDEADYSHKLCFNFTQKPKNIRDGFLFGSNTKLCDVLIGSPEMGISSVHFRITIDNEDRLVLIDSSTLGTAVSFNRQVGDEKRNNPRDRKQNLPRDKAKDFTWILFPGIEEKRVIIMGAKCFKDVEAPIIEFLVEIAQPWTASGREMHKTLKNDFLKEMRTSIPFKLTIDSLLTTAGQTEIHSPRQERKQRPIWIDYERIGGGDSADVYRAVDVSTGLIYAIKTLVRDSREHREYWKDKVKTLFSISHRHIIDFEHYDNERQWPRLVMEYLPLGNLTEQHKKSQITESEITLTLYQGLDALDYLHTLQIIYCDLKPENILVHIRRPNYFLIKLADFGLAKHNLVPSSGGTTTPYSAPEFLRESRYSCKVDIWSLGAILYKYGYSPPHVSRARKDRYKSITKDISVTNSTALQKFIASNMLKADPNQRLSASMCKEELAQLDNLSIPKSLLTSGAPNELISSVSKFQENTNGVLSVADGILYMTVRHQNVSMRLSDFEINATEVFKLSGVSGSEKEALTNKLKYRGGYQRDESRNFWTAYTNGVFLCQALGLEHDLRPLLSYPPAPEPPNYKDNYLLRQATQRLPVEFKTINFDDCEIAYKIDERLVNATHIVKAGNITRGMLPKFWNKRPDVNRILIGRGSRAQGTYVSHKDALSLCSFFGLYTLRDFLRDNAFTT